MNAYLDVLIHNQRGGFVYVIFGPMFSGKTGELFRNLRRMDIGNFKVVLFKPKRDNRHSSTEVVTHHGETRKAVVVASVQEMGEYLKKHSVDVIAIDEGQFFNVYDLNSFVSSQADEGKVVIIATLDQDFRTKAFDGVAELIIDADFSQHLHSICEKCGALASRSHRIAENIDSVIHVGGKESYEALCRVCYNKEEGG